MQGLQEKMRRNLVPTRMGPGTGYKIFENTMPMREVFKDAALKKRFEEGNLKANEIPGVKLPPHMSLPPRPPTAPEKLESTEFIAGQGMGSLAYSGPSGRRTYVFKAGSWRPSSRGRDTIAAQSYKLVLDKAGSERQRPVDSSREPMNIATEHRPASAPESWPGTTSGREGFAQARRPMTPADSKPYSTALRQLESEKRMKCGYFRPPTGSRDPALYKKYQPTRGNVLMVFNELDEDLNGKITFSEMVSSLIDLGCSQKQAESIFRMLDTKSRGFIELKEWGSRDPASSKAVEQLTLAYMRRHLGFPSQISSPQKCEKYAEMYKAKEVRSIGQAIAMARDFSFRKGVGLSSDGTSPMLSAFKFLDTDGSGQLDRNELMDGFFAIGVVLHPKLMDELWHHFDKDGQGTVDYAEFLETLMPHGK